MPTVDELIRRAADPEHDRAPYIKALLQRVGWTSGTRVIDALPNGAQLFELTCADEPQTLVVVVGGRDGEAASASLGYSREAPYALAWGETRVALHDSRFWRDTPGDAPLVTADLDDGFAVRDLLEVLVPIDVLEDLPGQYGTPSKRKPELHETLSAALIHLRLQVADAELMTGSGVEARDTAVLRLFHQLLFIRFEEDRGTARSDVELRALGEHDDVRAALVTALADYRARLNSSLFAPAGIDIAQLPAAALRDVVRELVEPWARLRLDFSVSRSEIAGRLYQSYLRALPARSPETPQATFFHRALPIDEREKTASYYTPPGLARLVVSQSLGPWLARHRPERFDEIRVLDPACGSGAFLIASYRMLLHYFSGRSGRSLTPEEREEILLTCVFGADVDERALGLAQVQLLEEAHVRGRLPVLGDNLLHGDSLAAPPGTVATNGQVDWSGVVDAAGGFDVVVTNPPFGASIKLPGRVEVAELRVLRDRYPEVYSGHADYAYVFAALGVRLLREGGATGFVLPRTLLDAPSGRATRELLERRGVETVTDFRAGSLFDIRGYVCTIATGAANGDADVDVVSVIDSRTDGRLLVQEAEAGTGDALRRARLPRAAFAAHAPRGWSGFRLRWDLELRGDLGTEVAPLVDRESQTRAARFGTKPGALKRFLVEPGAWHAIDEETVDVDGRGLAARFVPLVVRGGDLAPFTVNGGGQRLFLPFEVDGTLTEDAAARAELERRGGLPRHVQHGDLRTLTGPKLLLRTFSREPACVVDAVGKLMPLMGTAGAIAVRMDDVVADELGAYETLLNGALYQWLLQGLGRPKHGGWVELTTSDIEALPVPCLAASARARLIAAGNAARSALAEEDPMLRLTLHREARAAVDTLVFELTAASARLRRVVDEELVRIA